MIDIYSDGATRGYNGKLGTVKEVGLGVYIPSEGLHLSKRVNGGSNNEAEFLALILAMETALDKKVTQAKFNLDSKIVVKRAKGHRPKNPKYQNKRMDAFQNKVLKLEKQFDEVMYVWIPREANYVADRLSKEAHKLPLQK